MYSLAIFQGANSSLMESLSSEKELVEQLKTDKSTLEDQLSKMLLESEKLALKLENEVQEQEKTIKTMEVEWPSLSARNFINLLFLILSTYRPH